VKPLKPKARLIQYSDEDEEESRSASIQKKSAVSYEQALGETQAFKAII
jgi:hypothetical protein